MRQKMRGSNIHCKQRANRIERAVQRLSTCDARAHTIDRPLVDPEMPRRYPAKTIVGLVRVGPIECRLEAIAVAHFPIALAYQMVDCGQHYLGRKWQRHNYCPWSNSAIIWTVRNAAPHIFKESAFDPFHFDDMEARAVACGNPPAISAIARELEWILDRVLSLHIGRATTVLEIVDGSARGP
jgi:hypothetical protein